MFTKDDLKRRGLVTTGFHLPYNPKLLDRAKELRQNMTPAERKLWYKYLRDFSYKVYRQRPIDNYIVDFYCAKLKLVIEIDGKPHFTQETRKYDQERSDILEGYGLEVLRFTNREVLENFESVCKRIEEKLTLHFPPNRGD